jgi:hypothetical protein
METISFGGLLEFSKTLKALSVDQCLIYGVQDVPKAKLLTLETWIKQGKPADSRPRTAALMNWPEGQGILMLDYDPPKGGKAHTRDELLELLRTALPTLKDCEMLWWSSASSCIYQGDTEISGIKGQRIYLMVTDARDIPRAGKAILDHLWANGVGSYEVSTSGALLERGLFDASVWQPNRIDFAAGAKCHEGLVQKRGEPVLIHGKTKVIDSKVAIPDLDPELTVKAEIRKTAARASRTEDAKAAREIWLSSQIEALKKADPELTHEQAKSVATRAVESRTLTGSWLVTVVDGGEQQVSVQQILDNPAQYHRKVCLDPIEPDYDGRRTVGILFINGRTPCLHSHAHGGSTYRLIKTPTMIELPQGRQREAVQEAMTVLGDAAELFDFGDEIVLIRDGGGLLPLDANSLAYVVAGYIQFWRWKPLPNGGVVEVLVNPPSSLCNQLLALRGVRGFKKLKAVITAPTLRLDGNVVDKPGYDAATALYLVGDSFPVIPEKPTKDEADSALKHLMIPFEDFPFDTKLSRAVHLAAVITAVIRPILDRAPAIGYDAPIQGSGKTILAKCLAIIGSGIEPTIWPHTFNINDEETRKRLFSALLAGDLFLIWDNIVGIFDSAALASLLTSDNYRDRLLGKSLAKTVPNSSVVILTGNNLTLAGDLPRRVLVCRIDPKSEKPFEREFKVDPVAYCMKHRMELVAAVLTLLRFYIASGTQPLGSGQIGSFEAWDKLVRQTILYLDQELAPGQFGDVLDQLIVNQHADPEQESWADFLRAWYDTFEGDLTKVAQVIKHYLRHADEKYEPDALVEAIDCLANGTGQLTAKKLGKMLKFRVGRIAAGLCLEKGPDKDHAATWRVVPVAGSGTTKTGSEGSEGFVSGTSKSYSGKKHLSLMHFGQVPTLNPGGNPSNPVDAKKYEAML